MSELNGRKVVAAAMHQNIFIPGVGDIRKELSSKDTNILRGTKMTIDEPFLILQFESVAQHRMYTVPVPLTNFLHLVLESEVITTPPLK